MAEVIKELDITSLAHGGRGLGHHDGKAIFVPLTMPGDRVSCRVVKSKRRYAEADLIDVVEPSPLRREAPCPFFASCGGCQWQHLPYAEQTRWKEKTFSDLMTRSKVLATDRIQSIAPAPDEWNYRNRVQFKCHHTAQGLVIGFYQHGSHSVVDVDNCRLVAPPIQRTLALLRSELPSLPCPDCLSQVDMACGDDGKVRIILHSHPKGRRQLRSWFLEVVHGESDLTVTVDQPEIVLRYGPGGFVQVNSAQNRNMVATMLELLALDGTENILDLFCGMGNFSLPVARRAGQVSGVEGYAPSIAYARKNAAFNHISNVEFHAADASSIMARYQATGDLDLVILDPPRTGSYQVSGELLKACPERILYVSCDPATLVRDLVPLVQGGYEVISSQPFDLFPQTWHIESMTLLRRDKANKGR
jgi:23S rRNA (uracil1939-C5)-methyltransferase